MYMESANQSVMDSTITRNVLGCIYTQVFAVYEVVRQTYIAPLQCDCIISTLEQ